MAVALLITAVAPAGLAGQAPDPVSPSAAEIRSAVDEVLSRPAYGGERRGLLGFLTDNPITRWLAERWRDFVRWIESLFGDPDPEGATPSPLDPTRTSFGLLLLLGLVALAVFTAVRLARRREAVEATSFDTEAPEGVSRRELLDAAARAAAAGDHDSAVRLRFRAGLLELDERGVIDYDEAEPLGRIRREVALRAFDTVANGFERVAYSDHPAGPADTEAARSGWSEVLAEPRGSGDVG